LIRRLKSGDTGGEAAETIEDEVDRLKRELAEKNAQLALKDQEMAAQAALFQRQYPQALQDSMNDLRRRMVELEQSVQVRSRWPFG
jgi:predicted  nucleic acid-binding Zn-ribbon protein